MAICVITRIWYKHGQITTYHNISQLPHEPIFSRATCITKVTKVMTHSERGQHGSNGTTAGGAVRNIIKQFSSKPVNQEASIMDIMVHTPVRILSIALKNKV